MKCAYFLGLVATFLGLGLVTSAKHVTTDGPLCGHDEADVVLLLDSQQTSDSKVLGTMNIMLEKLIPEFKVSRDGVRVAAIRYGDEAEVVFGLRKYNKVKDMVNALTSSSPQVSAVSTDKGGNADPAAIDKALSLAKTNIFKPWAGSRMANGVVQMVIVVAYSPPEDVESTWQAARDLKADGVQVNVVGIRGVVRQDLLPIASNDELYFNLGPSANKNAIRNFVERVVPIICKVNCDGQGSADVAFLLDTSGSLSEAGLQEMTAFVTNFTRSVNIGPKGVQVSLIRFSGRARMAFDLLDFDNQEGLANRLKYIRNPHGDTLTHRAVKMAREEVLVPEGGARKGVPKVMVVITDGKSKDTQALREESNAAKAQGIFMLAIGAGTADPEELEDIATDPDEPHVFTLKELDRFNLVMQNFMRKACENQ